MAGVGGADESGLTEWGAGWGPLGAYPLLKPVRTRTRTFCFNGRRGAADEAGNGGRGGVGA